MITNKDRQVKVWLVVRGFGIYYATLTVSKGSMRMFLVIASSRHWTVKDTDIKFAFLQGRELRRDVYVKPPKECVTSERNVWKLKHGLYGLKDGAREFWFEGRISQVRV